MKNVVICSIATISIFMAMGCLDGKRHRDLDDTKKDSINSPIVVPHFIEDSKFMENPFNQTISIDNLTNDLGPSIKKTLTNNHHNLNQIDTLYEIAKEGQFFRFYKGLEYEILDSFSISNPNFQLTNGIKVGLSKQDFLLKFPGTESIKGDLISIANNERSEIFTFSFENDTLTEIFYSGYVD